MYKYMYTYYYNLYTCNLYTCTKNIVFLLYTLVVMNKIIYNIYIRK